MKSTKRPAFATVLSILTVSCSILFMNPTATLADHLPMPKNIGLSATALPDLSKLKPDPEVMVVGIGVLMRRVLDQEENLVSRVYSMPWEPEKNVFFDWRMAVPLKENPTEWEWKYFSGFEGGPAYETDKIGADYKKDENGQLTAVTVFIMNQGQVLETKTFVRPSPDKK